MIAEQLFGALNLSFNQKVHWDVDFPICTLFGETALSAVLNRPKITSLTGPVYARIGLSKPDVTHLSAVRGQANRVYRHLLAIS